MTPTGNFAFPDPKGSFLATVEDGLIQQIVQVADINETFLKRKTETKRERGRESDMSLADSSHFQSKISMQ